MPADTDLVERKDSIESSLAALLVNGHALQDQMAILDASVRRLIQLLTQSREDKESSPLIELFGRLLQQQTIQIDLSKKILEVVMALDARTPASDVEGTAHPC
ncbi:hypothetical protein [Methylocapsa palsarum]|uniref:Uncharacterized protein n=1 Tax=Methylocapsa palsarum TaxID=1612308 RepID=A0A1I4CJD5_9HYPH|nr:hypothetical protein [Methylocapsa palsarum]SFK80863.1 hypothetical protein SAMN05444581_1238 [Methylocapsa palsarum]